MKNKLLVNVMSGNRYTKEFPTEVAGARFICSRKKYFEPMDKHISISNWRYTQLTGVSILTYKDAVKVE